MKKNYKILLAMAVVGIEFTSCYKHNWEELHPAGHVSATPCVMPDTVSYNHDVLPIINASCGVSGSQGVTCHASNNTANAPDLSTYSNFSSFTSPDSLNGVYYDITWNPNGNKMPQNLPKLSQCDIDKIIRWMDQGSLNN